MRKLLCIILTVTLVIGMAVSSSAAVSNTGPASSGVLTSGIKAINETKPISELLGNVNVTINDGKSGTIPIDDLSELEIEPGDVIKIPLSGSLFLDSSGKPFTQANVSLSALNSGTVGVRTVFTRGQGSYTASLGGNKNGSYIKIEFDDGIYLTPQKFSSYICLTKGGARKMTTRVNIIGELQTQAKELFMGDDYADISDGSFVTAKASIRNVELYLGDYCTITRNLVRGQSYAGTATADDINGQDVQVLDKYPAIQYVYKLKTVGLKTSGNIVTFDLDSKYYVYNANGAYIGTSNQALPYWTKYYLSDKKYDKLIIKIS